MTQKRQNVLAADEGDTLAAQLERLAAANRRLQEEFERHYASEANWREERALLMAMLNQVPDYLFAKGRDGRFIMANKAVAVDLGKAQGEDLVGLTDFEMQPDPEVARKFADDDQMVMQSGRPKLDIEEFMHDSHGEKQWLSTSKVPLRNEAGEVIGLVGVARNVTERKRAQDQIHFLAYHDMLTGLPNRFLFEQKLEEAHAQVRRSGRAALLYLDLDRFKNVNDTLGHAAGDELIRQVARRLSSISRSSDTVARLGGDEFAVVMTDCRTPDAPEALSRRVLRELGRPFDLFDNPVFINVSIGIANFSGPRHESRDTLRQADIALYRAKAHGRARYEVFAEGMATEVQESRQIEQDLRQALTSSDELYAVYQPVYHATGGKIAGAEALLRWNHPTRGVLEPQTFINIAEEHGLIDTVGELMLRRACATALNLDLPWVAVNVSPVQFRNDKFADLVLNVLSQAGLSPQRLQLEITEGLLLESSDAVQATLAKLRGAGVKIALDDFGTGYSSMNYLRNYNVDKLKIDRSFVTQLGASEASGAAEAIVTAMVTLATAMQMRVTAEGIETKAQRDMVVKAGCHELQGFFLARPMSSDELVAFRNGEKANGARKGAVT